MEGSIATRAARTSCCRRAGSPPKQKSGRGYLPAAAAAPTYPSFRDTQLKKQCDEISTKYLAKSSGKFLLDPHRLPSLVTDARQSD